MRKTFFGLFTAISLLGLASLSYSEMVVSFKQDVALPKTPIRVRMRNVIFLLIVGFLLTIFTYIHAEPFTYHWEIDETPSGVERVSVIKPIEVKIIDTPIQISNSTASLQLARQYSIDIIMI